MHLRRDNQSDGSRDTHPFATLHTHLVVNIYLLTSQRDASCIRGSAAGKTAILPQPLSLPAPCQVPPQGKWEESPKDQLPQAQLAGVCGAVGNGIWL